MKKILIAGLMISTHLAFAQGTEHGSDVPGTPTQDVPGTPTQDIPGTPTDDVPGTRHGKIVNELRKCSKLEDKTAQADCVAKAQKMAE